MSWVYFGSDLIRYICMLSPHSGTYIAGHHRTITIHPRVRAVRVESRLPQEFHDDTLQNFILASANNLANTIQFLVIIYVIVYIVISFREHPL